MSIKRRTDLRAAGLIIVALVAIKLYGYFSPYLRAETFELRVISNDAVSECESGGLLFRSKFRSEKPKTEVFGFCGVVRAEHGAFELPETSDRYFGGQRRAEIDSLLSPGCQVELLAFGYGSRPGEGGFTKTGAHWKVYKVLSVEDCDNSSASTEDS